MAGLPQVHTSSLLTHAADKTSCLCSLDGSKSIIPSPQLCFLLHTLLGKLSDSIAAKCSAVYHSVWG